MGIQTQPSLIGFHLTARRPRALIELDFMVTTTSERLEDSGDVQR